MRYMLLRRSSSAHEAGTPLSPAAAASLSAFAGAMSAAGVLCAFESLQPSTQGVRLALGEGAAGRVDGPFADSRELIAGFAVIDVPTKQDALDWLQRWPADAGGAVIELREGGCPGGCAEIAPLEGVGQHGQRYIVLLRSSDELEAETPVPQAMLDALDAYNAAEAAKGVLLAADGLRTTGRGARFKPGAGRQALVDGPFTEIKELIAGYWLIRAASMAEAEAWARRTPYPCGAEVELEIRALAETQLHAATDAFTPALRAQEQHVRAEQLEAGMRAQLSASAPAWR